MFCYKCDDVYHPNDEGGLMWNDPEIGIAWPLPEGEAILEDCVKMSEKDTRHPGIDQLGTVREKE